MTPAGAVDRQAALHADQDAQATRTTAQLQHANARGLPVMIPGALDVRHWAPRRPWTLTEAAPPSDRGQVQHEWEGGGAPEMRGAGRRPWAVTTWLNRLLHGSDSRPPA